MDRLNGVHDIVQSPCLKLFDPFTQAGEVQFLFVLEEFEAFWNYFWTKKAQTWYTLFEVKFLFNLDFRAQNALPYVVVYFLKLFFVFALFGQ
jgi:hypothetical protein